MAETTVSSPVVSAPAGRFTGIRTNGADIFRGIRYAEPPVGELRFAAPVDAAPVEAQDATAWGSASLQDLDPLPRQIPGAEGYYYAQGMTFGEDCLNLNVWTASARGVDDDAQLAPVIVWFHGGGFTWGSGTGPWVDGTRFARDHGIVVVTVNYRLGILGNLWLGDIDPTISDLGIQDQTSALRWVQRNIEAFGGDPSRVTIMGQSAGAISVSAHLVAPASRGLFNGAIAISGNIRLSVSVDAAKESRSQILRGLGVDEAGDVLARLRTLSTTRIQQIQREVGVSPGYFPLVGDGVILPADSLGTVREGNAAQVPLLLGCDAEEGRLWAITDGVVPVPTAETLGRLLAGRDDLLAEAEEIYARLDVPEPDLYYLVENDRAWAEPAVALSDAYASAGNQAFLYEFTRRSTARGGSVGAAHLSELPFFWGNLDAYGVTEFLGDDVLSDAALQRLAVQVTGTVAQFVATGTADGGPLGSWPATSPEARTTMVIDVDPHVEHDRNAERLAFWRKVSG